MAIAGAWGNAPDVVTGALPQAPDANLPCSLAPFLSFIFSCTIHSSATRGTIGRRISDIPGRDDMATQLKTDPFKARDIFETGAGKAGIYRLSKLQDAGLGNITALPYSIRVLLESLLRNCDGYAVTE